MKFTVNSKALYAKLQSAAQVIYKKTNLPILECFLLGLRGDELNIAATDNEIRLVTKIGVSEANGSAKVAINAATLVNALKELPEQPITVEVNEDNLEVLIHYHNGKFNFVGQSADDYPVPKPMNDKDKREFIIDADSLIYGLEGALLAVSTDELRPVMCGVYFDITPDDMTFVASDGHKLVRLINSEIKSSSRESFTLPTKGAAIVKKLITRQDKTIKVTYDLNNAVFQLEDFTITCRFVEGRYPNYNSVIPQNNNLKLPISSEVLIGIIKRVSVFANASSNLVKFDLSVNKLKVSAQDIDYSTAAEETCEVDYSGDPIMIGFKSDFLLSLLSNIQSSEITIELSDPSRAALILPTSNRIGWQQTSLLMPMTLNS